MIIQQPGHLEFVCYSILMLYISIKWKCASVCNFLENASKKYDGLIDRGIDRYVTKQVQQNVNGRI